MNKFKKGDKVMVLDSAQKNCVKEINDMIGKICEIKKEEVLGVYQVWQPVTRDWWYFYESELDFAPTENIKVTIQNNNTTVKLSNGKIGKAHCKESDTYNKGIGVVIATARAYGVDLQKCADLVSKKENPDLTELKYIIERAKKILKDNEKPKYKITLTEFWKAKQKLGIHCNTEEKANTLLKAFDKLGKTWCDGESYVKIDNQYEDYKSKTVYFNNNHFGNIKCCKNKKIKVFEFEEVDLEN